MNADVALYNSELQRRIDKICGAIEGMTADQLNWRPSISDANSCYVIATHTLGNIRAWALGICCGHEIARDRPAEFRAEGHEAAPLIERARALKRAIEEALGALDPSTLDEERPARQELWGAGSARPVTGREALLHAIEHAAEHLGHIELTRDLAATQG